jgi:hypothetical protein
LQFFCGNPFIAEPDEFVSACRPEELRRLAKGLHKSSTVLRQASERASCATLIVKGGLNKLTGISGQTDASVEEFLRILFPEIGRPPFHGRTNPANIFVRLDSHCPTHPDNVGPNRREIDYGKESNGTQY